MGGKPRSGAWELIERHVTRSAGGSIDAGGLCDAIAALPAERIAEIGRWLGEQHARSRTWSLWRAASIIHDVAPDDTFDYFRSWSIGQGRAEFEAALCDPDSHGRRGRWKTFARRYSR